MNQNKLTGMGVALVTPFKKDGSVDYAALGRLVEYQIANHADYLVIFGTTAETPTLTDDEKRDIARFIIEKNEKRLPIVMASAATTRALWWRPCETPICRRSMRC